ncbi:MAG: helix-turn-helix domain-containing protein, partial [Nitrospirae bacterium]
MLKVADVEFIRRKVLEDGWSQRRVARELGISRQTVRKYLALEGPVRRCEERPRPQPVRSQVEAEIRALLETARTT